MFLAGERLDPDTLRWAEKKSTASLSSTTGGRTETGWAISANCIGLHHFPVKEGSPTKPAPGWNLKVVDKKNILSRLAK